MVAADTRITYVTTDGRTLIIDGPTDGDNSIVEVYPGKTIVLPYHYRKIRFIEPSWATAAGSSDLSAYILDLLKEKRPTTHEDTISIIGENVSRLAKLTAKMTGFELENIYKTTIHVGHLNSKAQSITLDSKFGIGEIEKGDLIINWPLDVSEEEKCKAQNIFFSSIASAECSADVIKAASALIATASHSAICNNQVQIGLTFPASKTLFHSLYFSGNVNEIANMTEDQIKQRVEMAK